MEKFNVKNLLRDHSTILIQTANFVEEEVIRIEILKYWHKLKIREMFLMRYLGGEKIELFYRKSNLPLK